MFSALVRESLQEEERIFERKGRVKMRRILSLLSCFLVLALTANGWAAVWYVTTDGSDLNDGQSWSTSFATMQKAVDSTAEGDEIWVATGTYILQNSIYVDKIVSIYGGFRGTETQLEDRDWVNNVTTVDGNNEVLCFSVSADARIDGLTIRNGYSWSYGGGIRNYRASPTIANCTFYENSGGMHGGAIYNYVSSSPTISNCVFYGNAADYYYGGAIYNYIGSSPAITNSTFHRNSAKLNGGAIANFVNSSPTITNSTFYDNSAGSTGGGIWNYSSSSPIITNTILWANTAPDRPEVYSDNFGSYPDIAFSDIQGGYPGLGNIDKDPEFVAPDNGDFHLAVGSPAIDVGDPDAPALPETDFEGDPRVVGAAPDMGVDEFVEEATGGLGSYVLYAKEKVRLLRIADSQGNIGSNGRVVIAPGRSGTLEGNLTALKKIRVMGSITVNGGVLTNGKVRVHRRGKLHVNSEITEGEEAGLSPIELPELNFTAGSPDVWVWRKHARSLDSGTYGSVRVMRGATLHLSSGDYYMEKLDLYRGATLSIHFSEGPVTINIVKRLHMGRGAKIDIESGATSGVTFNVLKGNILWFGPRAEFRGTLVAPNSSLWFGYRSELQGAAYAKRIYVSSRVHFEPHPE